jgi:shikimate kinase
MVQHMRYIIMTVGLIHSGKTTFGKLLAAQLPHAAILERDPIASMLNDHFSPVLRQDKMNWTKQGHEKLKDRIYKLILEEAINDAELTIILTGCHAVKNYRTETISQLRQAMPDAKVIMVYFDVDHEEISRRIHQSDKPTHVLTISKNFQEVIERQQKTFEVPYPTEGDYFFTVKNNENTQEVLTAILNLISR